MANAGETIDRPLVIREMVDGDLDQVVRLEQEIFPDPWSRSAFSDIFAEDSWGALAVECDRLIVGYACYLVVAEECHLANIAVRPAYRRKSVARRMLERILQVARNKGCDAIFLEVRVSNQQAISFYRKCGFIELYLRPGYYSKPKENALVMVLHLRPSEVGT